jgi:hypothetical protein
LNKYNILIQDAGGATYTTGVNLHGGQIGGGVITIDGGGTSLINVSGGNAVYTTGAANYVAVQNIKLETTTSGYCVFQQTPGYVIVGAGVNLLGCATGGIGAAAIGGITQISGALTISGNIGVVFGAYSGGGLYATGSPITVTISGSPTISFFAQATDMALIQTGSLTFSGAPAAGTQRYSATMNGVIETLSGSSTYFPGTVAGTTATGGQYH